MTTTETIRVDITADDIAQGVRRDCRWCPIARAVARALGLEAGQVQVDNFRIELPSGGRVRLPYVGQVWLRVWDQTGAGEPLSFTLPEE